MLAHEHDSEGCSVLRYLIALLFLIAATTLESFGDAFVRIGLFERAGFARILIVLSGGVLLLGYGTLLNLAPMPFGRVVGLYIATLFVVWQIVTYVTFKTLPSAAMLIGGALIVLGGLVVALGSGVQPDSAT